jgi:chromosome segregation ATPase
MRKSLQYIKVAPVFASKMDKWLLDFLNAAAEKAGGREGSIWKGTKKEINRITELIKEPLQESIEILAKEYIELYHNYQQSELIGRELRRIYDITEQKQMQLLHQKTTLESLSRELQKKYRQVQLENKELQNSKDEDLRKKFKSFMEEYHLQQRHFHAVLTTKEHEYQILDARCEMYLEQTIQQNHKIKALHKQIAQFMQTESELRKQLAIYVEKFRQVEETLNKSNELFFTFRKEMEQMSEKTRRLEEENRQAWSQHESMNVNMEDVIKQVDFFLM